MQRRTVLQWLLAGATLACAGRRSRAETPGVTPTGIKIGSTNSLSGPASANGVLARVQAAYFRMVNDKGGIAGRKIDFIYYDDGYSPPKTVEMVRRLVEDDQVAFLFGTLGTPSNSAIAPYCNQNHVPQLFISTGADKFGEYKRFPWTVGFNPSASTEAQIYAKYILKEKPAPKIAVLYQSDDFGKDYLKGVKQGLGDKAGSLLVKTASYEVTDPTVASQIVALQASGADVLVIAATPKSASQAIRRTAEIGWKPLQFVVTTSASFDSVLKPAGLENAAGLITATYLKDATDIRWDNDPGMKEWRAFMAKYLPDADLADEHATRAYAMAFVMTHVLQQCGNDASRDNVLKQALSLNELEVPVFYPGITASTSPTNHEPIHAMQLTRFNGKTWEPFGGIIHGSEV
jgi:branched-chain amino acid transport system substrate-binding protein